MANVKESLLRRQIYLRLNKDRKAEASRLIWPWLEPNEWRDKIYKAINENDYLAIMGHGSAAKTFTSCEWFLLDWWSHPEESALVITSDTLGSMDRRIWSDIKRLWSNTSVKMPGVLVDSRRMILYTPLDKKNAIAGIAAEDKDSQTKIQGLHTKRINVIIDEADNKDSESVWKAISNLGTSGKLKVVALANPSNRHSQFGRHSEPVNGWSSVNPESDCEWKSKLGWHVLRLDGLKSPNIVAGFDKYPFLLTNKGLNDIKTKKGEQDPEWWSYVRGIYAPQGDQWGIFPSHIIPKCRTPLVWYADKTPIGALDPALEEGGDACILSLGYTGRLAQDHNKFGVHIERQVRINILDASRPIDIDKGDQIIEACKRHGVAPEHFIMDATGEGRGIGVYIQSAWTPGKIVPIKMIRFGGDPTEMAISSDDPMPANQKYDRFVSELWYVFREWAQLGYVWLPDSLPRELAVDLESRLYRLLANSGKISIETKKAMKGPGRNHHSPDHGDSGALMIHLARILSQGFKPGRFEARAQRAPLASFKKMAYVGAANYGVK